MQVYKAFFKVVLKNLPQIMIYFIVFISVTSMLANTNSNALDTSFNETKVNIAFINYDTDSKLIDNFRDYLNKYANIASIPNDTQKLQDALFFRQIEYIVTVPKGFTEAMLNKRTMQLEKTTVPDSTSGIYLDSIINKYMNTAQIYINNMGNVSFEKLLGYIDNDLEQKTEVKLNNSSTNVSNSDKISYYFNYLAYAILGMLILGISSVMTVFNNRDLKMRNLSTPLKQKSMNYQMILGNFSFAVLSWFVLIITGFVMYGSYMFSIRGLLFLLNSFIFTLAALSISYLIGNFINSKAAISAATNVIALGTSFISGVFVPQALLGNTVLKIASFTPNYWYVKSNNYIANLTSFGMEDIAPVLLNMLVVMGFSVAILSITLVIIKQKRVSC